MTRTVIALVLTWTLILTGCQSPEADSGAARDVSEIHRGHQAQLLEQINRKYENPEAHYQLAKLYQKEGLWDKADYQFRIVVGFDPVHYRAQAGLVKVLTDSGQAERAQIIAELYTSQTAVSEENSLMLGKAFRDEGLDEYALNCYFQAVGLAPESPEAFKLLGFHYLNKKDMVRAEEYFRRSFELNPYQADVSGQLGRMGVIIQGPRKTPGGAPQQPVE